MNKAQWNEFLIYFKNRPIPFLIIELVGRLGKVVKLPGIGYFINDPDIGKQVLNNPECFNSHDIGSVGCLITQVLGDFALINMDSIKHKEWKTKLRELFTPKFIQEVFDLSASSYLQEIKSYLHNGDVVDLAKVSKILASRMACGMIGANLENDQDSINLFEIVGKFTSYAGLGKKKLSDQEVDEAKLLAEQIAKYAKSSFNKKQRDGSVTQRLKDLGFTFEEVKGLLTVILVGGTELVSFAIPRIMALLVDSNQLSLLRKQPELITQTMDEGLRFVTPSSVVLRSVSKNAEIEGYKFESPNRALIVNYNMLKSKKYFDQPRKFDITRKIVPQVKHSWFGGGPHFCLGFALAHKEIRSVLEMFIELESDFKILKRTFEKNKVFPGYKSLQIQLIS
ncbi:MAG: cytochrome P450 [Patescibacteria group bacterium]